MSSTARFSSSRVVLGVLGMAAVLAFAAPPAQADVVVKPGVVIDPNAKLINISASTQVFYRDENLKFTVLRAVPGTCAETRVTIDGKSRVHRGATFPWTFEIAPRDVLYPTKNGKYEVTVEGVSGCSGKLTYTFAYNGTPQGAVTDLQPVDFANPDTAAVQISGRGECRFRVATYQAPYDHVKSTPLDLIFDYYKPTRLPLRVPLKRTAQVAAQWGGDYIVEILAIDSTLPDGSLDAATKKAYPGYEGCAITAPGNKNKRIVQKTFSTVKATPANGGNANNGGNGAGGAPGGGGGGLPAPKPANGKIVSMLVPGGSFAEDEAQKIQVNGQGGCGFDLTLSNKTYGGSSEETIPVLPMKLDGGATLYNGTHFGTLAEGSWKANVVGKNGCTGTATIDFKVTSKTSTKKVMGKPTIAFDQQPKGGGNTFVRTKDSNIWFKVTVPQSIKDEPYATCCDIEYDYVNEYGGWDVIQVSDSSYANAVKLPNAVAPRSVSYFSNGMSWRVKMKASKFKTEFEWSDWLEFKTNQN